MINIIIAVIVTFVVTALWGQWAHGRHIKNYKMMFGALLKELDDMAKALGHEDFITYLKTTKGEEYAARAGANIISTIQSFTARGAD